MAKFRKNHGKEGRRSSFMGRAVVTTVSLIGLMIYGFINFALEPSSGGIHNSDTEHTYNSVPINTEARNFIPDDDSNVVHHSYYSLGYNPSLEVPNWVAYKLTEESLKVKNVKRANRFKVDNRAKGKSAKHSDYSHSGYTRGHMAPAGDMAFSNEAMQESFYMSNMTPQLRTFNGGVWRELEENVRDWAYDNDELYIVSGPIFYKKPDNYIGKSTKVAVPDAFFKAILDIEGNKKKSIGFIIPHEETDKHLREFAVTLDEIEAVTKLDLFADLLTDESMESELEGQMNVNQWQINRKRFDQRVKHWNNQK